MSQTLAFYKPYEVLSQFTDEEGRQTLKDFVPIPGVYAAGRLDYRSEGLLLLSNDGLLIQRLTDPRFDHPKTYLAQVEGVVKDEEIRNFQGKILIPDFQTKLAQIEKISEPDLPPRSKPVRPYHPTTWLRIVLREGKKHLVRKITAAMGYPTLRLVRVSIGKLQLGSLQPGEWRPLTIAELAQIRKDVGLKPGGL